MWNIRHSSTRCGVRTVDGLHIGGRGGVKHLLFTWLEQGWCVPGERAHCWARSLGISCGAAADSAKGAHGSSLSAVSNLHKPAASSINSFRRWPVVSVHVTSVLFAGPQFFPQVFFHAAAFKI